MKWGLLAALAISTLTVWLFPSTGDFHPQNPFWNGLEGLQQNYRASSTASATELLEQPQSSMLLVVPYRPTGEKDLAVLRTFLAAGGTIVLADDFGHGNKILERLDVSYRFDGSPLLDPIFNYRNQWFPLATATTSSAIGGAPALALNYATSLQGEGFSVLASSSALSYMDVNGDGEHNAQEPSGPFPVAVRTQLGNGVLVLISDPSLFVNGMIEAEGNARFVEKLLADLGPQPRFYVFEGLSPRTTLTAAKEYLVLVRREIGNPLLLALVAAALVAASLYPIWRKTEGSSDTT